MKDTRHITHTTKLDSEEHTYREFRAATTRTQIVVGTNIVWIEMGDKVVPKVVT